MANKKWNPGNPWTAKKKEEPRYRGWESNKPIESPSKTGQEHWQKAKQRIKGFTSDIVSDIRQNQNSSSNPWASTDTQYTPPIVKKSNQTKNTANTKNKTTNNKTIKNKTIPQYRPGPYSATTKSKGADKVWSEISKDNKFNQDELDRWVKSEGFDKLEQPMNVMSTPSLKSQTGQTASSQAEGGTKNKIVETLLKGYNDTKSNLNQLRGKGREEQTYAARMKLRRYTDALANLGQAQIERQAASSGVGDLQKELFKHNLDMKELKTRQNFEAKQNAINNFIEQNADLREAGREKQEQVKKMLSDSIDMFAKNPQTLMKAPEGFAGGQEKWDEKSTLEKAINRAGSKTRGLLDVWSSLSQQNKEKTDKKESEDYLY